MKLISCSGSRLAVRIRESGQQVDKLCCQSLRLRLLNSYKLRSVRLDNDDILNTGSSNLLRCLVSSNKVVVAVNEDRATSPILLKRFRDSLPSPFSNRD
jgi:hypothetical protein